ncbi:DUF2020 domain-containing protein [Corynebacterium sp. H128]|uniref:DUF2020 domain-containing protein n=1 Tax=Corynebacterium sp. H128 TaxID=3133427 RepID=UPI003098D04F
MKRLVFSLVMLTFLSACAGNVEGGKGEIANSPMAQSDAPLASSDQGLPPSALPEVIGGRQQLQECPYLDSQWVADTNGQRVLGAGIDERFDTPACVFWSYAEEPQLTVLVRRMSTEAEAEEVVNWAAPIASTEPAEEPAGWTGGRMGSPGRSLYAVYRGNTAVVTISNQDQSFKAELVAKEVIKNLGL